MDRQKEAGLMEEGYVFCQMQLSLFPAISFTSAIKLYRHSPDRISSILRVFLYVFPFLYR
jgi:hypothetical protein